MLSYSFGCFGLTAFSNKHRKVLGEKSEKVSLLFRFRVPSCLNETKQRLTKETKQTRARLQKRPFVERFIVAADARIIWVVQAS
jgi:hypothetical protein